MESEIGAPVTPEKRVVDASEVSEAGLTGVGDTAPVSTPALSSSDAVESIEIPVAVADAETVVRAIKTPMYMYPSGKALRPKAFYPRARSREISVVRVLIGADECKRLGRRAVGTDPKQTFLGLASGSVGAVRELEADVLDEREDFLGHAHIVSPLPHIPLDEPATPEERRTLDRYYKAMVAHFVLHRDPNPESDSWTGGDLAATA